MYVSAHARALDVFAGKFQRGGVDVAAANAQRRVGVGKRPRFLAYPLRDLRRQGKVLECETAHKSGCGVGAYERRLYGQGARAAERVEESPVAPPHREKDYGRGECFAYGRLAEFYAVSALVEPRTRGVEGEGHRVVGHGGFQLVFDAVLGQPRQPVAGAKAVRNRLFGDALYVAQGEESAPRALCGNDDCGVTGEDLVPAHGAHPVIQFVESGGGKFRDDNPHPSRRSQKDVCAGDIREIARETYPPVLCAAGGVAEPRQLALKHRFRPGGGGRLDFQFAVENAHGKIVPSAAGDVNRTPAFARRAGEWARVRFTID